MQCPNDQSVLVMSERKGVEIDYCPTCRGVWLDRGELDKIIDRSVDAEIAAEAAASPDGPTSPEGPTSPGPSSSYYGSMEGDEGAPTSPGAPATGYPAPGREYDERGYGDRRDGDRRDDDRRYDDRRYDDRRYDDRRSGDRRYDEAYRKRKKKESWIGELFDF